MNKITISATEETIGTFKKLADSRGLTYSAYLMYLVKAVTAKEGTSGSDIDTQHKHCGEKITREP